MTGARPPKVSLQVYKKNGLDEKQQSCCWLWIKRPGYVIDYNNFEKYICFSILKLLYVMNDYSDPIN